MDLRSRVRPGDQILIPERGPVIPRMLRRNVWLVIARQRASGATGREAPVIETRRGDDRAHRK